MADREALGQILQGQQANGDAGSFEEYRNRKGKVLPGYNPVKRNWRIQMKPKKRK